MDAPLRDPKHANPAFHPLSSMALPTPPNSGREPLHDTFDDNTDLPHQYSPLFSPRLQDGRRSPSDALLFKHLTPSRHPSVHQHHDSPHPRQTPLPPPRHQSPSADMMTRGIKRARREQVDEDAHATPGMHPDKRFRKDSGSAVASEDGTLSPRATSYKILGDADIFMPGPGSRLYPHILNKAMTDDWLRDEIRARRGVSPPRLHDVKLLYDFSLSDYIDDEALDFDDADDSFLPAAPAARKQPRPIKRATGAQPAKTSKSKPKSAKAHGDAPAKKRKSSVSVNAATAANNDNKPTRSKPTKKPHSNNPDHYPDYSPAILDQPAVRKAAETYPLVGAAPKDYSNEPYFSMLHPTEVILTSRCAVPPQRYIVTKRRVFLGFLKYLLAIKGKRPLRAGDEQTELRTWNKTAAQQLGKMDVNRTSAIYQNFWDKAGLFAPAHYARFLEDSELPYFPEFDAEGVLIK